MIKQFLYICLILLLIEGKLPTKSSSDIGYVLHLTDLHWDPYYKKGSYAECLRDVLSLPCCHSWEIPDPFFHSREAGTYGDYNCDSPMELFQAVFPEISKLNAKYQFDSVIWTGDNPNHSDLTQSTEQNLHAIETLTNLFKKFFPRTQIFPCLGNHDTWPVDQLSAPPEDQWLTNKLVEWWGPWVHNENDIDNETLKYLGYGGWFDMKWKNLRLISLNTLFFDSHNELSKNDPGHQLNWFEDTLKKAEKNKEPVWIIGHIFPGNAEARDAYSDYYNKLVSKYNSTIIGQFFGHSHHDEFTFTNQNIDTQTPTPSSVIYIAPSITPISVMNPSARIYVYNRTSYEILDYITYFADLIEANEKETVDLKFQYNMKETYQMKDFSLESWVDLAQRLVKNSTLFDTWVDLFYGNAPKEYRPCDANCIHTKKCQILFSAPQQRIICENTTKH